jgi:hypothetical protein
VIIFVQALSETSDLEALRREKRAIQMEVCRSLAVFVSLLAVLNSSTLRFAGETVESSS